MINKKIVKNIVKKTALVLGAIIILLSLFIGAVYVGIFGSIPSQEELKELSLYKASEIYDVNKELIGKFYIENRQPISIDNIPSHVVNALVAVEDARFYEHSGVDYISIGRVAIKSILLQDKSSGGGSTITQQLAKNLFSRKDYSFLTLAVAKTKEIFTANRLESIYSKNEIIELYLNTVPFSGNTNGIESASRKFFNKPTNQLTVSEAATLIGTLKATTYYHPLNHKERALQRRDIVLHQMNKYGYITEDSLLSFKKDSLQLVYGTYDEQEGIAPYFRERLRQELLVWCKEKSTKKQPLNLYTSGLKIYTTIDKNLQLYLEQSTHQHLGALQKSFESEYGSQAPWSENAPLFKNNMSKLPLYKKLKEQSFSDKEIMDSLRNSKSLLQIKNDSDQNELLSITDSVSFMMKSINTGSLILTNTGALRAYVGGANFNYFKYDHIKSKRQVGSTFKPIVYATALENGASPCDYFEAREIAYENHQDWSPSNSNDTDERYLNYSMKEALTRSINTVSVKVLEEAGISNVISLSRKLNIKSELPEVPSLALGTAEISVEEMGGAYTSLINEGKATKPYYLLRISDESGKVIEQFDPPEVLEKAFSTTTQQQIIDMMQNVVNNGTGKRLRSSYGLPNQIAGKTGTTQSNKDAWFIGVTPELVFTTWVGFDDHRIGFKSTRIGQGANAALPITALTLQKINANKNLKRYSKVKFPPVSSEVAATLDCEPTKRDGFLKRLFTNPDKKRKRNFRRGN